MEWEKIKRIIDLAKNETEKEGKRLFWKQLKEYYLTLKTDEEKNKVLSMIFKDK